MVSEYWLQAERASWSQVIWWPYVSLSAFGQATWDQNMCSSAVACLIVVEAACQLCCLWIPLAVTPYPSDCPSLPFSSFSSPSSFFSHFLFFLSFHFFFLVFFNFQISKCTLLEKKQWGSKRMRMRRWGLERRRRREAEEERFESYERAQKFPLLLLCNL